MPAEPADPVANFDCDPRYEVQKVLGQGSYGVVCSAFDSKTGEMVAIKKMSNVFSHPLETKRTLRELRLLRHFIEHENVLTISNVILPKGQDMLHRDIFVVTEMMDTDLDQVIRSQQPLSMMHVQTFLYQILRGLQYIHASNVIHRDLKPGNILVNQNCTVKICDFGLARLEPETGYGGFMTEYVVTRWYRAPEIMLSGQDYNQSIDVWATGCILAEMLLRRPLFPGKNYVDQVRVIVDVIGNPTESGLMMIEDKEARDYVRTLPHKPALDFSGLGLEEAIGCTPEEAVAAGDLMHKMLLFDPKCRSAVRQAMDHPLLQSVRSQDNDVFKPVAYSLLLLAQLSFENGQAPQFKFDFEREEKEEELLELMLEETEHYKRLDAVLDAENEALFGGIPPEGRMDEPYDMWEHQPMASEPSPSEAANGFGFNPLGGFDPLGDEQYEVPEEYLSNEHEWSNQQFDPRDSLQFMNKPAEVPPFGDAKYNTMIAINQRLMVGEVDETQWGTKLLTPVCEERMADLLKENKQFASVLAQERASSRAKEHQAKQSQQKQRDADNASSQLPPRRRVKDMGSDSSGAKKTTTKSKSSRANSAGKSRPASSASAGSRPRSAMASKKDKSFMPPIPQRSKRKDPLPAAAKVGSKTKSTVKRASSASKGRPASSTTRKPTVAQSRKGSSSDTINEKARLQSLLNSLQQKAHDELASSNYRK